jgi:hypothetical protein
LGSFHRHLFILGTQGVDGGRQEILGNHQILGVLRQVEHRRVEAFHPLTQKRPGSDVGGREIDVAPPEPFHGLAPELHQSGRLGIVNDDQVHIPSREVMVQERRFVVHTPGLPIQPHIGPVKRIVKSLCHLEE